MTRQTSGLVSMLFVAAYLGGVAVAMWVNTSLLCLGDAKFDAGCGGFELYFPLWALSYVPPVVLALVLARPREAASSTGRKLLLSIYLVLILAALEASFVADIGLAGLGIVWLALAFAFFFLRSLVSRSAPDVV
ncbi:MAG: hypothetical protein DWQ36_13960 [Acidobacteria bacterium]|nr:MAG: hypothetical protein DWQ30_19995 [Acidobacteriota bacterium]REK06312.1 MAG: hypothetical protein DWQ36_13960 [Acidobacteriota bacterium]